MMDDLPSYSICYNDHCLKVIQKSCKPNVHFETSQGTKTFAKVFVKMKETAEAFIGKRVTHSVVIILAFLNYMSPIEEA